MYEYNRVSCYFSKFFYYWFLVCKTELKYILMYFILLIKFSCQVVFMVANKKKSVKLEIGDQEIIIFKWSVNLGLFLVKWVNNFFCYIFCLAS